MAEDRLNPLNNPTVAQNMRRPARDDDFTPPDEQFEDFIDQLSGVEPDTEPDIAVADDVSVAPIPDTPAVVAPPPAAAPEGSVPVAVPSPPPQVPVAPEPRFTYNGKQYTVAELAQQGLLTEALQKASQFDARQQSEPQQPQQPQRPPTMQEMQDAYGPAIRQAVDQGFLEEDVVNLYPATVTSMVHMRAQVDQIMQAVIGMAQWVNGQRQQSTMQTVERQIDDALNQAAGRGQVFAALNQEAERQKFRAYLRELNPIIDQITPDFVARQWLASKTEELIAQQLATGQPFMPQAQPQTPAPVAAPMPAAAPPRTSGRGTRQTQPVQGDPWDDMLEGLL